MTKLSLMYDMILRMFYVFEEAYAQALRIMRNCGRVICCLKDEEFGEMNDGNRCLLREAEKVGLNVERRT